MAYRKQGKVEYECLECGKKFKRSNPPEECPSCGGSDLEVA